MKTSIKTFAAANAVTALVAGPASAMVVQGDLAGDVRAALGGGSNITVLENNGVVTLTGYFADAGDQAAAVAAAKQVDGVSKVINLAFPNS